MLLPFLTPLSPGSSPGGVFTLEKTMKMQTKITTSLSQAGALILDNLTDAFAEEAEVALEEGLVKVTISRTIDQVEVLILEACEVETRDGDLLTTINDCDVLVTTITREGA